MAFFQNLAQLPQVEAMSQQFQLLLTNSMETVNTTAINDTSDDERSKNATTNAVILTFVSKEFVHHIDFWYSTLTTLGYTQHHVAAWDEETLDYCQQRGYRSILCITTGL
eukprot:CAMPEP_0168751282 /NCGR_PEP_ID=MMETSP0724-20121128/17741_1 /TAXON_ID=265536 /ORGANISM="Amphiprora sp., Strain CCMP467" /LENGTH=109 /DNA_ID=CAMNT_0008799397 /DNA_START=1 /DNA_END=330 /DNA_ORIENTATION=+